MGNKEIQDLILAQCEYEESKYGERPKIYGSEAAFQYIFGKAFMNEQYQVSYFCGYEIVVVDGLPYDRIHIMVGDSIDL